MNRIWKHLAAFLAAALLMTSLAGAASCTKSPPKWRQEKALPRTADFYGVWGSSSSDVFVVGLEGAILHYDGRAWTEMDSGTGKSLYGVWGTSSADVFAVGESGTILHYNGAAWTAMKNRGVTALLCAVWGSCEYDVYAVGALSTILHYDGATWRPVDSGVTLAIFNGVWGSSTSDVFAVGDIFVGSGSGLSNSVSVIMHYDGATWNRTAFKEDMNVGSALSGVWGNSASDVYVVGESSTIACYDGQTWKAYTGRLYGSRAAYLMFPPSLNGVWGSSGHNVLAVGDHGNIVHGHQGEWSTMKSNTTVDLNGVWGSSSSNVFAVGTAGTIMHYSR